MSALSITAESTGSRQLFGSGQSKIIRIGFKSNDKDKIRFILRELSDYLISFNEQRKSKQIEQNLRYVNSEISRQLRQIEEIEGELRSFRSNNQVFSPSEDAQLFREQLDRLQQAQQDTQGKIVAAQQQFRGFAEELGMTPQEALVAVNLSTSPSYTSQLGALRSVEQKLAEQISLFPPNSPLVQQVAQERQELLRQLQAEAQIIARRNAVRNPENLIGYQSSTSGEIISRYIQAGVEYESLLRLNEQLGRQLAQVEGQLNRTIDLNLGFRKIEQRLAAAQEALRLLLQTRQSIQLQLAQQDFTWELLSDIDDEEQYTVTLRLLLALVLAAILGGFSGAALAIILDLLDPKLLDIEQVRKEAPVPILGDIPWGSELNQTSFSRIETPIALWGLQQQVRMSPPIFEERFLFLLGHLQRSCADGGCVAITSARNGEGRTTTAIYLGLAAAVLGQRVLLVDANLQAPGLHEALGIPNTSGIAELLNGTAMASGWLALRSRPERLWVLTAGQGGGRLSSAAGIALLKELKAAFDWVIIDTPPQLISSETNRLVPAVDGALAVVRLGYSQRAELRALMAEYRLNFPQQLLGIVLNGLPLPKEAAPRTSERAEPMRQ